MSLPQTVNFSPTFELFFSYFIYYFLFKLQNYRKVVTEFQI